MLRRTTTDNLRPYSPLSHHRPRTLRLAAKMTRTTERLPLLKVQHIPGAGGAGGAGVPEILLDGT